MELYIFSFKYTYQRWVRNYNLKWIVIIHRAVLEKYVHPNSHKQCFKYQLQSYMQEITKVITQFHKTKNTPPSNSAAKGKDHSKLSSSLNSFLTNSLLYCLYAPLQGLNNFEPLCRSQLKNSWKINYFICGHFHIWKNVANIN